MNRVRYCLPWKWVDLNVIEKKIFDIGPDMPARHGSCEMMMRFTGLIEIEKTNDRYFEYSIRWGSGGYTGSTRTFDEMMRLMDSWLRSQGFVEVPSEKFLIMI